MTNTKNIEHKFVYENGYHVCCNCGIAKDSHYWDKDQSDMVFDRNKPKEEKYFMNNKWKNLLRKNNIYTMPFYYHAYTEILFIVNLLPFPDKMKKNLREYMISKKFKSCNDVIKNFYKLICKLDLPITSAEFLEILKSNKKQGFKPLTKLRNVENVRKYYWYINKQIEQARKILNFSNTEKQELYKIVLNYYNLIRFKMCKSSNPIYLIENLIYYTIREKLRPLQTHFNKNNFKIQNPSYITTLVKFLKEIKKNNLDSSFSETLEISQRNKKLANQYL